MHVYFYMYLLKRPHGHRVMLQRLCRCILGSEVKLAVSEVLNLVHSFEPKLQEQHLSPSAFHTLITAMFSLISLPLWKLFLWGGLSVRGQARGRPKACHWYNVELKTVGFVLTSLLPLSVLHLTQFISHTLDFFFVTVVLSGDCSVFAQTESLLKGCMSVLNALPREADCMHACILYEPAGDQRMISL